MSAIVRGSLYLGQHKRLPLGQSIIISFYILKFKYKHNNYSTVPSSALCTYRVSRSRAIFTSRNIRTLSLTFADALSWSLIAYEMSSSEHCREVCLGLGVHLTVIGDINCHLPKTIFVYYIRFNINNLLFYQTSVKSSKMAHLIL